MRHHSPLVSVHRLRVACPVCGHRDNCAVTEDGTRAYCRRVRSDYQGKDGGWLHILDGAATPPPKPVATLKLAPAPIAERRVRHDIYTALLRSLPLRAAHYEDLKRRGLSVDAIRRGAFKSTPTEDEAREIVSNLDCDLSGVPGFYVTLGCFRMVKTPTGYFIPVRDRAGLIQALQMRRDHLRSEDDPRYTWLSSNPDYYPQGTSSGAPVHIERPERITETGRAIITEGALKAFVSAEYLDASEGGIIALAGTSAFKAELGQQLKEAWPMLRDITIAFDGDWRTKKPVAAQLHRLIRVLKSAAFDSVEVMEWPEEKGLDDYLFAQSRERASEVA